MTSFHLSYWKSVKSKKKTKSGSPVEPSLSSSIKKALRKHLLLFLVDLQRLGRHSYSITGGLSLLRVILLIHKGSLLSHFFLGLSKPEGATEKVGHL